jgi:hypothetical protein
MISPEGAAGAEEAVFAPKKLADDNDDAEQYSSGVPTSSSSDLSLVGVVAAAVAGFGGKGLAAGAVYKVIYKHSFSRIEQDIPAASFLSEEVSLIPNMFDTAGVGAIARWSDELSEYDFEKTYLPHPSSPRHQLLLVQRQKVLHSVLDRLCHDGKRVKRQYIPEGIAVAPPNEKVGMDIAGADVPDVAEACGASGFLSKIFVPDVDVAKKFGCFVAEVVVAPNMFVG